MDDLLGRRDECAALDRLVADVLAGSSRVLVLRGEAGVGKSALLAYLSGQVIGWQVVSAVGVESEMDLAYSGLHQMPWRSRPRPRCGRRRPPRTWRSPGWKPRLTPGSR